MKISTTTADFLYKKQWAKTPAEAVSLFKNTSFRNIDFTFCFICEEADSPFYEKNDKWKQTIFDAANEAEKIGAKFVVAHSHISHKEYSANGEDREHTLTQLKNSIEACNMLGIKDIVIHGYFAGKDYEEQFENNKKFFEDFTDALEKYSVNGLIENGDNNADFLLGAIKHSENPRMHAVWDVGHANIGADNQYDNIVSLGKELHALHVHDNFGKFSSHDDLHLTPFFGTVNFDEVMCALIDSGYQGYFNLEAVNTLRSSIMYSDNLRHKWPRDTRALDASPELKVMAEEFMYNIIKELLTKYNCFEE